MNGTIVAVALSAAVLVPAVTRAQEVQASQRPPCEISQDADYGYTVERPVQVGGGPLYGKARQHRYLDALRGPEGQAVSFKRTGAMRAPDATIVDRYELTYEGLEKPIALFLDWYHSHPQQAPRGLTCGKPVNLGPPPLDPFRESDQLQEVALAQGATREFAPLPLGGEGAAPRGAIYERFRLLANAARAAAAKGAPLGRQQIPRELLEAGTLVVAYPVSCDGRTITPLGIAATDPRGQLIGEATKPLPADKIARLLPGVTLPDGVIVISVPVPTPRNGDSYVVSYSEAGCGMTRALMEVRVTITPARGVEMPPAVLPDGADAGPPMLLQVVVDTEGKIQVPAYIGGAPALLEIAKESLGRWRVDPARANGAPIASGVLLQVQFTPKK